MITDKGGKRSTVAGVIGSLKKKGKSDIVLQSTRCMHVPCRQKRVTCPGPERGESGSLYGGTVKEQSLVSTRHFISASNIHARRLSRSHGRSTVWRTLALLHAWGGVGICMHVVVVCFILVSRCWAPIRAETLVRWILTRRDDGRELLQRRWKRASVHYKTNERKL